MAILEVVEAGHEHVEDLRHELGVVRGALDRTDAILGVTDEALERAEQAIVTGVADLIADAATQGAWAARLAPLLQAALVDAEAADPTFRKSESA